MARAALSLVVVGLASDDFDGAEAAHHAALERGDGYAGSDEAGVGGKLLHGFTSQSEEALAAAVSNHLLSHLENEVLTLPLTPTRTLTLTRTRTRTRTRTLTLTLDLALTLALTLTR